MDKILILVFFIILFYTMFNCKEYHKHKKEEKSEQVENSHDSHQKSEKTEKEIIDSILNVIKRIKKYQEDSIQNGPDKQEITEIGMQIHHIDTIDTKDHEYNPIAKIIHEDVAHDLLRTHSVLDKLLEITNEEEGKIQEMTNLVNDINSIPDKNFKPSSKEKLIQLIEYMKTQETIF